jgi:hypothetical protein
MRHVVLPNDLDPELVGYIQRGAWDLRFLGKFLFPDIFEVPYSILHHQVFDHLSLPDKKKVIAAPRGIGKTSIARLRAMQALLYRQLEFVVYIGQSAMHAIAQTENIKRELLSNNLVRKCFGNVKIADVKIEGLEDEFSKAAWVAFGRTCILPRGIDQQVRGLNWNSRRPQLYIIDDLENKDEITNPDNRKKLNTWFRSDVEKSVDRYRKDYEMVYIDTIKHEDSMLVKLLESLDWKGLILSLCDEDYNSYDPNYMTTEEILREVEVHRKDGNMDVFYMEFMNQPISKEDASFKEEHFRYYNVPTVPESLEGRTLEIFDSNLQDDKSIETVVLMDPAKTVQMNSAESAIVAVGIDVINNRLFVRDIFHDKVYPDELYHQTFLMAQRTNARTIGIESTGLEEFIKQPFTNEMLRRGTFYELVWLKARGGRNTQKGKEERISALVTYYRQGLIYHNYACCNALEQQLLSFPRSRLWDIMDAFAYIIEMLDIGNRFFQPPMEEGVEDEFADLDYEDPIELYDITRSTHVWQNQSLSLV